MNPKLKTLLLVLLAAAIVVGAVLLYNSLKDRADEDDIGDVPSDTTEYVPVMAGDFTVYTADNTPVALADFAGRPVMLNFWASWCNPCKSEMPDMQAAYEKYGRDVVFIMINMTDGSHETLEKAQQFISDSGYTFPVYYDTAGSAAGAYNVRSIPMTVFIDRDGYIQGARIGVISAEKLEAGLTQIQGEPAEKTALTAMSGVAENGQDVAEETTAASSVCNTSAENPPETSATAAAPATTTAAATTAAATTAATTTAPATSEASYAAATSAPAATTSETVPPESSTEPPSEGQTLYTGPEIISGELSFEDAQGNTYKLSDFYGQPLVVNFWASWCPPCKSELPYFNAAASENGSVRVLMINLTACDSRQDADALISENGYTFPVYYCYDISPLSSAGYDAIPDTLFVKANGEQLRVVVGSMSEEQLAENIRSITE